MCTLCGSKAMDYTTSFHTHTHTPEEWAHDGIGFPPTPRVILPGPLRQPDRPLLIGFSPSPLPRLLLFFF